MYRQFEGKLDLAIWGGSYWQFEGKLDLAIWGGSYWQFEGKLDLAIWGGSYWQFEGKLDLVIWGGKFHTVTWGKSDMYNLPPPLKLPSLIYPQITTKSDSPSSQRVQFTLPPCEIVIFEHTFLTPTSCFASQRSLLRKTSKQIVKFSHGWFSKGWWI